ncbi:hypothetical protein SSPIM334S_00883 [Streptomyces spiroverticillatus]
MNEKDDDAGTNPNPTLSPVASALLAELRQGYLAPEGTPGLDELVPLRLSSRDPITGLYGVTHLRHAERTYLQQEYARIEEALKRARGMSDLIAAFENPFSFRGITGVERLANKAAVNAAIQRATSVSTSHHYSSQINERRKEVIEPATARDIASLERGIKQRTIYPESARTRAIERAYVAEVSAHGAEVRTTKLPF